PSPRASRWAGPFDGALAYALAWSTAGIALLSFQGVFVTIGALLALHGAVWPGVVLSCLLLALIPPAAYRRAFPGSRIAPLRPSSLEPVAATPAGTATTLGDIVRHGERLRTPLVQPATDIPRVRARVVKTLGPSALPDDSFDRCLEPEPSTCSAPRRQANREAERVACYAIVPGAGPYLAAPCPRQRADDPQSQTRAP